MTTIFETDAEHIAATIEKINALPPESTSRQLLIQHLEFLQEDPNGN